MKVTTEQFIEKAKKVQGEVYDYSLVEYKTNKTKVRIICSEHGEFLQTPSDHLAGCGCPKCKNKKIAAKNTKSNEQFIQELKDRYGDSFDYSETKYTGKSNKVSVKCPVCGTTIEKLARTLLSNCKCPVCSKPKKVVSTATVKTVNKPIVCDASFEEYMINNGFVKNGDYFENDKLAVEFGSNKSNQKTDKRKVQIVEYEWKMQNDKVRALFSEPTNRIFARKCELREIDNKTYRDFCEANHLQNYTPASVRVGLFYKGELVQIESFGKARYKRCEWELIRECSKCGYYVVGGKSRLLKYFDDTYKPTSLVSYCEKNKFSGQSYIKCGFELVSESNPGYYYYKDDCKYSRVKFQKYKLAKILPIFDESLSETANMLNNGYEKIYDYGNYVFVKNYQR